MYKTFVECKKLKLLMKTKTIKKIVLSLESVDLNCSSQRMLTSILKLGGQKKRRPRFIVFIMKTIKSFILNLHLKEEELTEKRKEIRTSDLLRTMI